MRKSWLKTRITKEAPTKERDEIYANTYLAVFDDYEIGNITPILIQEWVTMLTEKYAPKTVRLAFDLMSQVFEYAILPVKALSVNPCKGNIQLPKIRKKGVESSKCWTQEKLSFFLSHPLTKEDNYYNAYILQATCGARPGEVCGLSISDISLTHNTMTFNYGLDKQSRQTDLKNTGAQRTLSIPPKLLPFLINQINLSNSLRLHEDKYKFLIVQANGSPFNPEAYAKHLKKLIKRINKYENQLAKRELQDPSQYQDVEILTPITPYGFRHTFATLALLNGTHMKSVAEIMGNTVETVMQNYAHVLENSSADALIKMTNIISLPEVGQKNKP